MNKAPLSSAWIWPAAQGVNGLRIDTETGTLHWYDDIGCACDTSTVDQTIAAYRENGVPGFITIPPADVEAEIGQLLAALDAGRH